jgi:hypothetical protein
MKAAKGFRNFEGEHCATTALRQVFACRGIKLSEEMLLGLGEGIGFDLNMGKKGELPVLNMRGAGLLELEKNICCRLGIEMKVVGSKNKGAAEKELLKLLGKDEAAVVYVDVEKLPYTDRGRICHAGAHAIAVAGVDLTEGNFLVADTDEPFHRVALKDLAQARLAARGASLPANALLKFTYPKTLAPIAAAIEDASRRVAERMLSQKDKDKGVQGIARFGESVVFWPDKLGVKETCSAFNAMAELIETSGSGGGGFRKMYGRFLGEASRMLKDPEVASLASAVTGLARKWSTLAGKLKGTKAKDIPGKLEPVQKKIVEIAESEEAAWQRQSAIFE